MRVALAVVSVLVLAGTAVVVNDQFHSQWQDTQKEYFKQALNLAKTPAEKVAIEAKTPKLEQTIVTGFGAARVDRCESCHIAVDDPRFGSQAEPLTTHPCSVEMGDVMDPKRGCVRKHKFTEFGCTLCHDGQGRGLDKADAHGEDEGWTEPMLGYTIQANWAKKNADHLRGKDFIQAACARCHADKGFKGTEWVTRGRELYFKEGCFGCHKIEGLSSGSLGADLTQEGRLRKLDYLWGHTVDPREYSPTSVMPAFKLSDDDKKALVIFLKSRRGVAAMDSSLVTAFKVDQSTVAPVPESAAEVEATVAENQKPEVRGQQLIEGYACLSCHKLGDRDGGISPDLSYEGLIRDQAWLVDHFRSPRSRIPDSNMPAFGLPDKDFEEMAAYLLTRTTPPPAMTPAGTFKALCSRCHGEKGDGKGVNAIYLDPAPRNLTSAEFINSKPESRFLASITLGVPGTSMPPWGKTLTADQIQGVFDYVQTNFVKEKRHELKPRKVPETNPVASSEASIAHGEEIFLARCTGCHGRKADGKGPNSPDISPRPRNLRNTAFIQAASDRRLFESIMYSVEGTAMPSWVDYGLSQNDVGDIVNYIRSLQKSGK